MKAIQRGEECAVTDEAGKCHAQAVAFYFGPGRSAELHVCPYHHKTLFDREVDGIRRRPQLN